MALDQASAQLSESAATNAADSGALLSESGVDAATTTYCPVQCIFLGGVMLLTAPPPRFRETAEFGGPPRKSAKLTNRCPCGPLWRIHDLKESFNSARSVPNPGGLKILKYKSNAMKTTIWPYQMIRKICIEL